jgi:HEAT repeat protein
LEEKVRGLFLKQGVPDLRVSLRELGDDKEIAPVLVRLASGSKHAKERSSDLLVLSGAVASLGELRASSANELLSSLLTDREVHENVRALAARSLGQIDPEGNKQSLLNALNSVSDHYLIRVYAAEGLAKTRDAEALKALERYSREEKDAHVRQQFEKAAEEMRAKGVKPN